MHSRSVSSLDRQDSGVLPEGDQRRIQGARVPSSGARQPYMPMRNAPTFPPKAYRSSSVSSRSMPIAAT